MKCNRFALLSISLSGGVTSQGIAAIPQFYPVTIQKIKVQEKSVPMVACNCSQLKSLRLAISANFGSH
jgi:hypothetical protein